ncbi:hypothetical protein BLNAU_5770 [Blattamonas nauphoetae]|uniref:Transposase n=1 Tax=Blattamonas nauphoetae TaxID=2049346 RepID=A0ABQ9Y642_9EUKA|nr:hypothetical protein BLNAU_5770 [Blattamonas nauphoetae]
MLCCQPSMDGFPARDKRALLAQFDLRINYGALINFKTGSVSHELILMKLKAVFLHKTAAVITACAEM